MSGLNAFLFVTAKLCVCATGIYFFLSLGESLLAHDAANAFGWGVCIVGLGVLNRLHSALTEGV